MSLRQALEMTSATDTGQARSHNEDCVAVDAEYGLAILADGMGGYNAGEIASGMAVTLLMQGLKAQLPELLPDPSALEALLRKVVATVNGAVYEAARTQPQCAGMGTTLVMAVFYNNRLLAAHIGDSRLYRLRGGQLTQLTHDHSLLQAQIDSGMISQEDAIWSSNKNLVTRALGVDPKVPLEVNAYDSAPNDMYLLCSDGLTDMVTLSDIQAAMELMGNNLPLAANEMIKLANEQGGRDNISVALVKIHRPFPAQRGMLQTLWSRLFGGN